VKTLTPAERLIVAADFKPPTEPADCPPGRMWVVKQVMKLAGSLKGTGVYLKVNSALRAHGYGLIDFIHSCGLKVFADLKLFDIGETLSTDGTLLREARPELLTVSCMTGIVAMKALKAELPDTEVLGVTVLTSIDNTECFQFYRYPTVLGNVCRLASMADSVGMDGVICSAKEAPDVRQVIRPDMTINAPAIRPAYAIVPGDDQNPERIMTPAKAIRAGADRIVVGRPIVRAENPYDAVMRTIQEIDEATYQPEV
jgi:orotidine-5'-phosphate decarboxylase